MPRRILLALDTRVMHRIVAVLVLASSVGMVWLGIEDEQQSECNARYNERSARSAQVRADAAERDREALEVLVRSLVDENTSDGREQVRRYLEKIEETDRQRSANPVPPPPPDLCN